MKMLDAVEQVLTEAGAPLHYEAITKQVLEKGLWTAAGKTPEATVNARLAVDIKTNRKKSRFQRTDKGMFALRAWGLPEYKGKKHKDDGEAKANVQPGTMSFTKAAAYVLEKVGNKKPLHYRDITTKVMELGLVVTASKAPEATLAAQIVMEIQRRKKQGVQPRFVKYPKGYIGLAKWMATGLAMQIQQHNQGVRKKLLEQISTMPPDEFEQLIGKLLVKIGVEDVVVTSYTNDKGIDVRGTLVTADVIRTRMAVQVKRWQANVQSPVVQQVRGSLGAHEQGLIITTSDFAKGAVEEANRADATPVALMNGQQLVKLLVENDIGIRRTPADLIELGEDEDEV
jgi:restriction system protein